MDQALLAERSRIKDNITNLKSSLRSDRANSKLQILLAIETLKLDVVDIQMKITGEDNNMDTDYMKNWRQDLSVAEKRLKFALLTVTPTPAKDDVGEIKRLKTEIEEAQELVTVK